MTKIIFDIKRDNGYGKEIYPSGTLSWFPAQAPTSNPLPKMDFILGAGPIDFEIPGKNDVYWSVVEYVSFGGPMQSYQRTVSVPESETPINYLDLEDVDPNTFFDAPENS